LLKISQKPSFLYMHIECLPFLHVNMIDWSCLWFYVFCMLCRGCQYPAIADEIRDIASKDPAHRKLFVRGLAWETTSEALRDVSAWMA
jgi:hypothetical protein